MSTPTSNDASARPTGDSGELAPNYFTHTFDNGLRVVGQRMPSLASVTFGVQVPGGIREEPEDRLGLTALLADMMFQGTETRNVRRLTEEFEAIGARKGGENAMEYARYSAQIVGDRLDRALDLFADVMLHPAIPDDEFNQMRSVQLQDIRRRDDEPMRRIFDVVRERFYTGTTLARRGLGLRETVEQLTPDDLRAFYRKHYSPRGALISIAGAFDWDHAIARIGDLFGDWQGEAATVERQRPQPQTGVTIEPNEGNQEHIGMAFPFPTYGDPDYYAATVALEIFGGGMTSRLFREVREKRGLVYSVAAMFAPNGEYGAGYLYAGASPDKARETVTVMLDELRLLQEQGVTEDELARAKTQIKSEVVMRGESSAARMGALARAWWFEGRLITIQEVKAAIDGVTTEQILGLLRRFPPTKPLVIGAIGPRSEEELIGDSLTKLG